MLRQSEHRRMVHASKLRHSGRKQLGYYGTLRSSVALFPAVYWLRVFAVFDSPNFLLSFLSLPIVVLNRQSLSTAWMTRNPRTSQLSGAALLLASTHEHDDPKVTNFVSEHPFSVSLFSPEDYGASRNLEQAAQPETPRPDGRLGDSSSSIP